MRRYEKGDYLFDGFAHRPYEESCDGWRNALPDASEYACVMQANSVLDLFEDLAAARRRIWELERKLAAYEPVFLQAIGAK